MTCFIHPRKTSSHAQTAAYASKLSSKQGLPRNGVPAPIFDPRSFTNQTGPQMQRGSKCFALPFSSSLNHMGIKSGQIRGQDITCLTLPGVERAAGLPEVDIFPSQVSLRLHPGGAHRLWAHRDPDEGTELSPLCLHHRREHRRQVEVAHVGMAASIPQQCREASSCRRTTSNLSAANLRGPASGLLRIWSVFDHTTNESQSPPCNRQPGEVWRRKKSFSNQPRGKSLWERPAAVSVRRAALVGALPCHLIVKKYRPLGWSRLPGTAP